MLHRPFIGLVFGVALVLVVGGFSQRSSADDLAKTATDLLKNRCFHCHGEKFSGNPLLDVSDVAGMSLNGHLVSGDPDASLIWQRVRDDEMPEDAPLDATEKEILKRWIAAGAPVTTPTVRPFLTPAQETRAVNADLRSLDPETRQRTRYLSLRNLHNDANVSDSRLNLYRNGVSKLVNSVSQASVIVVPGTIDSANTVLRIDLSDYGWNESLWNELENTYPYGVRARVETSTELFELQRDAAELTRSQHPVVRADWFVDSVSRPTFYHRFLDLPNQVTELEKRIGVDVQANFRSDRLVRAGFATSGVSVGNRLVERHDSRDGYYWKSFDFTDDKLSGNLFQRPLGPIGVDDTFKDVAFRHDGGEMIYSLPNGLQAYYLSDGDGKRLDRGPISVVRDDQQTGGTAEVTNAVSCMNCHRQGLIDVRDTVRLGHTLRGELSRKVSRLHPENERLQEIIRRDRNAYLRADAATVITPTSTEVETSEPIGALVRHYGRDLNLASAAAEVDLPDTETLANAITHNRELGRLGLSPLAHGGTIKRSFWSSRENFVSAQQETARVLGLGTPNN